MITIAHRILNEFYGIKGAVSALVGDVEFNFKVSVSSHENYILKITEDANLTDMYLFQAAIFNHLKHKKVSSPLVIPSHEGHDFISIKIRDKSYFARLLNWQKGNMLTKLSRRPISICNSLGELIAQNTKALLDFNYLISDRKFKWNTDQGLWVKEHVELFGNQQLTLITHFISLFENHHSLIESLPKSIIHNDFNEANILFETINYYPRVTGIIDYGDACYSSTINNLAIGIAYAIQFEEDTLSVLKHIIQPYFKIQSITPEEFQAFYVLTAMRLVISLTSAAISAKQIPDNEYHQISVNSSWKALEKLYNIGEYQFTEAALAFCDQPSEKYNNFRNWVSKNKIHVSDLFANTVKKEVKRIDLGLESEITPHPDSPYYEADFEINIQRFQQENSTKFLVGGYGEVRNFYVSDNYEQTGIETWEHRTKHLGIDIWESAGTKVCAAFDGEIYLIHKNTDFKDYGTLLILKHSFDKNPFYTLYGHLSASTFHKWKGGELVKKGEVIGELGDYQENGNWVPHLHFQIILDLLGKNENFDGVARPDFWCFMARVCPDPNMIFHEEILIHDSNRKAELFKNRKEILGYGLSLSYKNPLHIVRGSGVYLIDQDGQKYLDTVNNVAHVGHENYNVVKAGQKQIEILNTNTRYLNKHVLEYAGNLLAHFPKELCVVHFTNSGSEANELALRMAKTYANSIDILAIEVGYHGNTGNTISVSSYKFNAKGGSGKPENTHLLDLPDSLRGKHCGDPFKTAALYVHDALAKINNLKNQGTKIAGFIHESILSCGGQIVLPPHYLKPIYKAIRDQGGVCIADEVQVGFGRVGDKFWGFELQDVIPDIVVLGKPIANGHPMGAVICTHEIAKSFNNGMEYFNTFGGNPVSAVMANAVLKEIETNNLQENAKLVGNYLISELRKLQAIFPFIADVRGHGLFLGIEFLDNLGKPDADFTSAFAEHMRDKKILMSTDGPDHNIIKIKPPFTFTLKEAEILMENIEETFQNMTW